MLRTGVSEKALRRIMAEDGLTAHVPRRRRYNSYEGETTPAPDNPRRPRLHGRTAE